jgi:hypothetical protein
VKARPSPLTLRRLLRHILLVDRLDTLDLVSSQTVQVVYLALEGENWPLLSCRGVSPELCTRHKLDHDRRDHGPDSGLGKITRRQPIKSPSDGFLLWP